MDWQVVPAMPSLRRLPQLRQPPDSSRVAAGAARSCDQLAETVATWRSGASAVLQATT